MNIAILTQPICNNYGGILQNYALQTVLERKGHRVTTLNYPVTPGRYDSRLRLLLSMGRRALWKMSGHPGIVWINPETEGCKAVELAFRQKKFIDKYLHLKDINPPITPEQVADGKYDVFVVGSDQVWRPRYNRYPENMFLDFAVGMDVKRIAYAASLGTDKWEYTLEQTSRCAELARQFDAISVREASGVDLCCEYLGVEAVRVLDPTLLLEADDYLSLCSGHEHPDEEYIAVYTLDYTKKKMALLNKVSEILHIPLHFIGRFTKDGYPSVDSWLEGIANAKYVITDSFHGTVFSIIFNKPFFVIGNEGRGLARFQSLLSMFELEDRLMSSDNVNVSKEINWEDVNSRRERLKQESINFINASL